MVSANAQPPSNMSLKELIRAREVKYLSMVDECKALANKVVNFNELQREENLLIAQLSLERLESIPPLLEELFEVDDFEGVADLLRPFVKSDKNIDGILSVPIDEIYAILRKDDPKAVVQKMITDARTDLRK